MDVSGADAYPTDARRNYATPADNPIPRYNAAHPATPLAGLGEVYVTGIRNASRVSVDRATGDIYMGDVGEFRVEEVNVLRAGGDPDGPPADFGWPQREGTQGSGVPGAPQTRTNPFTGVASLEPVRQFNHFGGGNAVIGGYVYRGPVTSLTGKYLYADYVSGRVWQLELDRDTDPSAYNGSNGILTEVTSQWNGLVVDPNRVRRRDRRPHAVRTRASTASRQGAATCSLRNINCRFSACVMGDTDAKSMRRPDGWMTRICPSPAQGSLESAS